MDREQKIQSLVSSMTLEEKIGQLLHESPAIDRLDIPKYNWWNECLHGVARAGGATIFPQAIGMAASFDDDLLFRIADAISDEARAKYNLAATRGEQYHGLTFWTPNVNIFRDPRWGRGQETYGEDPLLTSRLGTAFVRGLQGDNPDQMKTAACAKHFAVHSGPETLRHSFNAETSMKDLHETYLPAFQALVEAGVEAVMGAYNRTLGEPCCASHFLMEDILRGRWEFKGHYVSDCWAIRDFHEHHGVTKTAAESAALAVNTGCDLNCGCTYGALTEAVELGLIEEKKIDESATRLLRTRFRLGMLDSEGSAYDKLGPELIRSPKHIELSLEAARKSLVLLKNDNNILPVRNESQRVLLIGPAAANPHVLIGNYHGLSPNLVTVLEGITAKIIDRPSIQMDYHQGCLMHNENRNTGWTLGMAEAADLVIAVFGNDNAIEGEEGDAIASHARGDRTDIELPPWQLEYLQQMRDRGTPVILVLTGGSPIAIPEDIADAVIFAWYPGEQGGTAIADVIFGDVTPSGKLPITFPKSTNQLPPYEDYAMEGRTYRYLREEPLYPFGFGLSYTSFSFDSMSCDCESIQEGTEITVKVTVSNTGDNAGDEVVQLYVQAEDQQPEQANFSLRAYERVHIPQQESRTVEFRLKARDFETVNEKGERILISGAYRIIAANCAPFKSATEKGAAVPISKECRVV
ncbi:glycoside hydrolase family 3 C-terminal domain-containing protein [Spirochaeta dissipatitropha]